MARTVVVQQWEESELGWGVRPDGCSLHLSDGDRAAFIKAYTDTLPDEAPAEYSRPAGSAYLADVDADTYRKVIDSKQGIWSMKVPKKI